VNTQVSAYYNVVRPDNGANWQIRVQAQLMFPKKRGAHADRTLNHRYGRVSRIDLCPIRRCATVVA
jgi:hypothetical protein